MRCWPLSNKHIDRLSYWNNWCVEGKKVIILYIFGEHDWQPSSHLIEEPLGELCREEGGGVGGHVLSLLPAKQNILIILILWQLVLRIRIRIILGSRIRISIKMKCQTWISIKGKSRTWISIKMKSRTWNSIKVKGWIRVRIEVMRDADPQHWYRLPYPTDINYTAKCWPPAMHRCYKYRTASTKILVLI